jgi:hypothetical protein
VRLVKNRLPDSNVYIFNNMSYRRKSQHLEELKSALTNEMAKDRKQNSNIFTVNEQRVTKTDVNRNSSTLSCGSMDKVIKWWDEHQKLFTPVTECFAAVEVEGCHWCTAAWNCKRFYSWIAPNKGTNPSVNTYRSKKYSNAVSVKIYPIYTRNILNSFNIKKWFLNYFLGMHH